jgi:type II restriction/modification system DNA methylase subunit YeeA
MDTSKLRKFATLARTALIEQVSMRLKTVLAEKSLARRESPKVVEELEKKVNELGQQTLVEAVAYTWFNRFCALRYMDVNRYTRIGVLSPAEGQFQPEILSEAKMGHIDQEMVPEATRQRVLRILDGTDPSSDPQGEAYRLLLVAVCNHYHSLMPFMFEKIADYTELLLPDDLLSGTSIPAYTREALLPENCSPENTDQSVEVIGWLYQFYIADKKDAVMARKAAVPTDDIPAVTQLFTPHWIVRYLVENSLGRLWMLNHPDSKLIERMDYYIKPEEAQNSNGCRVEDQQVDNSHESNDEPHCWKIEWQEQVKLTDGEWSKTMWLRPNPDYVGDYNKALWYALTIDGHAYAQKRWRKKGMPDEQSTAWEKGDFGDASFEDLRCHLYQVQRSYRWSESEPSDDPNDPFWLAYRAVCDAWNREWKDHRHELAWYPESKALTDKSSAVTKSTNSEDFLKITSPEEIKICDPACGSGHMLTYAYDLLYAIYNEQGYAPTEIPGLILRHNLFGIELCDRAAALASFALCMKARASDARYFRRVVQPNVISLQNVQLDNAEVEEYVEALGLENVFDQPMLKLLHQFEESKNFGSLIQPCLSESEIHSARSEIENHKSKIENSPNQLFLRETHLKVLRVLEQAEALTQRYHVVVANPPYMNKFNKSLKDFLEGNLKDYKNDLFAAFIIRSKSLAVDAGFLGFMSPFVWMFLSSYEKLRLNVLNESTLTSLVQLEYSGFDGATVPICTFTIENKSQPDYRGVFIRLSDFRGHKNQAPKTLEAISNPSCGWLFHSSADDFKRIPGWPIAYWLSASQIGLFEKFPSVGEYFMTEGQNKTSDNEKYLRFHWEVSKKNQNPESRWPLCAKGGDFRKWAGNIEFVIDWSQQAREFYRRDNCARIIEERFWFKDGVTWTDITSSSTAFRLLPSFATYETKGPSVFPSENISQKCLLGALNTVVVRDLLRAINPTLSTKIIDVRKLPIPSTVLRSCVIERIVDELVNSAQSDWDNFETSWDFRDQPLLRPGLKGETLEASWRNWEAQSTAAIRRMQELETENNRLFIAAYGLDGELQPEVPEDQITLARADARRDMAAFLSYAVGCMMGRYSPNHPGLILANAGDTIENFRSRISDSGLSVEDLKFIPDEDGVIPVLDGEWFKDDIVARTREFLRATFGEDTLEANLRFIEQSLGKDLRKYFLTDFYKDHLQTYKKRPIYWLFSSPKGTFNALIYMHRYRTDTVGKVLECLRDFRDKLSNHSDHQQMVADSGNYSAKEKTAAIKQVATIKKQLKELEDYEKTLFEVAAKKISIDLDDGVKHNYPLFGSVLKKIPGLDAKED